MSSAAWRRRPQAFEAGVWPRHLSSARHAAGLSVTGLLFEFDG
jgi:hypothetical protein